MYRSLGASERFAWVIDQTTPINVVLAATITGSLTVEQVTQALNQVQNYHPLLKARIVVNEQEEPCFITEDVPPIPLEVRQRHSDDDWCEVVQTEFFHSFSWENGPLIRLVFLQAPEVCELILTFHHSIGDGLSGAYLIRDILEAIAEPNQNRKSLSEPAACEDLYPYCLLTISPDTQPENPDESDNSKPVDLNSEVESSTNFDWQLKLLHWSLSTQETAALVQACRQEQTTVHGILCAAFLGAIAEELNSPAKMALTCLSMVNLRKYLVPAIGEDFGSYVSAGLTQHPLKSLTRCWEVARDLKYQLDEQIDNGSLFQGVSESIAFWATKPDPAMVYQIAESRVKTDLVVTNLGPLHLPYQFNRFSWQRLHLGTPGLKTQTFMVGVATLQGKMFVTFRYLESITPGIGIQAERISHKAKEKLLELCRQKIFF